MTPKSPGIYAIVHRPTGRRYVGSSVNLAHRLWQHRRALVLEEHLSRYLQNTWNKHGESEFDFVVLELVEDEQRLVEREQFHMDVSCEFNLIKNAASTLGYKHEKKTRARMRKKAALRWAKESEREKIGRAHRGKIISAETKALWSKNRRGKPKPWLRGRCTEKQKAAAIERARKRVGIPLTAEWKAGISRGNSGKVRTPEMRERVRQSVLNLLTPERRIEVWKLRRQQTNVMLAWTYGIRTGEEER